MEKRFNENWEIIGAVRISDGNEDENAFEIVVAHNPNNRCTPYVTWEYSNGTYYWGHYCTTKKGAMMDFIERIKKEENYF